MNLKQLRLLLTVALALPAANLLAAPLVVHEWGTFTSLQNEKGEAIGGINTDDEPVPKFVHRLRDFLLLEPTEMPAVWWKGLVGHALPDVTMRLETPVLYFHPSTAQSNLQGINVTARFNGGWLSEFYPNATALAPGMTTNTAILGPLNSATVGALAWNNLEVGGNWPGPATGQHVWTSPRGVEAANVRTTAGEAEKFLFYRGVGHIDAPLAISQNLDVHELTLHSQLPPDLATGSGLKVKFLWLVDIRADGQVAFRSVSPVTLSGSGKTLATISSSFSQSDHRPGNLEKLKASLFSALIAEGLFADEAHALLNTWEVSYFKSTGLRVFFLVPRAWTEHYLPLEISTPAEITRVMVGRIELITPAQRDGLHQLAQLTSEKIAADQKQLTADYFSHLTNTPATQSFPPRPETFAGLGITPPHSYQSYLDLGRFRNALILDEARRHPAPGLDQFISHYRLEPYQSGVLHSNPAVVAHSGASVAQAIP